jgi:hypothetical protein
MGRDRAFAFLPALLAMVMLVGTAPTRAQAILSMTLCVGGSANIPGKTVPRDCDQACHAACQRRKTKG